MMGSGQRRYEGYVSSWWSVVSRGRDGSRQRPKAKPQGQQGLSMRLSGTVTGGSRSSRPKGRHATPPFEYAIPGVEAKLLSRQQSRADLHAVLVR
jgi:hypothetical protein